MPFAHELANVLPSDLPNREIVIAKAARHLDLIVEANQQFNLTRITDAREAAIKHVLDSVMPWRLFSSSRQVLDAGSGAGFPGIPLALVLPATMFILCESIGKKARFIDNAVELLELTNVSVAPQRAEEVLRTKHPALITARAVAPIVRVVALFRTALQRGSKVLLYKGPEAQIEIEAAKQTLRQQRFRAEIIEKYELPEALGSRTIVEITG